MALITSHTLNSVDGTHAGNIGVALIRIYQSGERETLLNTSTDDGGRFSENISFHRYPKYENQMERPIKDRQKPTFEP